MISSLSEQLRSCYLLARGMETESKKYDRNSNGYRKSDTSIVSKKPLITVEKRDVHFIA